MLRFATEPLPMLTQIHTMFNGTKQHTNAFRVNSNPAQQPSVQLCGVKRVQLLSKWD